MGEVHPLTHRLYAQIFHELHFRFDVERIRRALLQKIAHAVQHGLIGDAVLRVEREPLLATPRKRRAHDARAHQGSRPFPTE